MSGAKLTIVTLGQFRVTGPDGEDLTPTSQKACAVLALLCDAPNHTRTRVALQDKLWSDRGGPQGAASLRQALSATRKALGPYRDVMKADARTVRLDSARVSIDLADPRSVAAAASAGLAFLDGIAVRDPEFEDWLRDRRLALEEVEPEPAGAAGRPALASSPLDPLPSLCIASNADGQGVFSDYVLHAIGRGVADYAAIDLRDAVDLHERPAGVAYVLESHEKSLGDGTAIRLQLSTFPDRRICWQRSEILTASDKDFGSTSLARLINHGIDGTIAALAGSRPFGSLRLDRTQVLGSADTLRRMWLSAARDPVTLTSELEQSFRQYGRGIDLAWQAFVWCFVVGERRETSLTVPEARQLIRRAIELEPNNSLVLALASHIYGFVLRQFEASLDLAERAVQLDRNNILAWAFLGVARINLGMLAEGYQAAEHARRIAGEGPYRDYIDGIYAFAATLTRRTGEAISVGETVHAMRPDFAAALRYLLASYVSAEDYERAGLTALRLRDIEPDFDVSLLAEPEYPVEPLRRSSIVDVRKLPKLL